MDVGCWPGVTRDDTGWALLNDRILLVVKEEWSLAEVILDVCVATSVGPGGCEGRGGSD